MMKIRNILLLGALALSMSASSSWAGMPDDIRVGTFVELEGLMVNETTVMAKDVEVKNSIVGDAAVKGLIKEVNSAERTVVIGGVQVVANPDASIENEENLPMDFSEFVVGRRGKAEGRYENGVIKAHRLKLKRVKEDRETEIDLGGNVSQVDRKGDSFTLLGMEVLMLPTTVVEVE